jgi:hypothetical protein
MSSKVDGVLTKEYIGSVYLYFLSVAYSTTLR